MPSFNAQVWWSDRRVSLASLPGELVIFQGVGKAVSEGEVLANQHFVPDGSPVDAISTSILSPATGTVLRPSADNLQAGDENRLHDLPLTAVPALTPKTTALEEIAQALITLSTRGTPRNIEG
ncbi:hypothetical protein PO587_38940 [Streptomyces gilvifuscus]|uniref:Uncharacterized protein n=1 Tax=Streptomyces gilvifuscus TaxID=1550617 RepID=A0ABT5G738_9ACTN|nr:hypothetical protein [Streptomyces gilvifuscus]MDC2960417.1 hypothetical protein [Streptomyces gilvifuscus]